MEKISTIAYEIFNVIKQYNKNDESIWERKLVELFSDKYDRISVQTAVDWLYFMNHTREGLRKTEDGKWKHCIYAIPYGLEGTPIDYEDYYRKIKNHEGVSEYYI